ncbi:hypothetical protein F2P45_18300 [Massilia sp. CCM 8733]|uniref:PepSY domain-containing protein n=1 Tax=Massilia mucilaginosa TaxID=2609282 RepID=A0ABX0NVT2_9BURK|nr:PepSY-associated TM helix domain-containing protein [Massilia mucilaginosa]NHZ90955.1 hypothetical protein [Massilia mucilaginosa]
MDDHPQATSPKAWYLLHSWAGIILALMVYVVCASGSVALFVHELQLWQYPELQRIGAPPNGEPNVEAALAQAARRGLAGDSASFQLPHHTNGLILRLTDDSDRMAIFDPVSGALVAIKPQGFGHMLRRLHSDLLLPFPIGAYVTGLLGIALLFLVLTGVMTHRRLFREVFTLRTGRGWRLSWSDTHKVAGTWGMVFLGMMGFTGSILGLAGLLLLQTALVVHRGDAGKAYAELTGSAGEPGTLRAAPGRSGPVLAPDIAGEPFVPRFITFSRRGDAKATVTVDGERPDYLSATDRKIFDAQGQLVALPRGVHQGAGWRTYSAMLPLHFGDFGGAGLKFVYLILGLAACMLPVSGIVLWLDRQRRAGTLARSHRLMQGLCAGVTLGFPIAFASLFLADRLAPGAMAVQGAPAVMFIATWAVCAAWALWRGAQPGAVRGLLGLAGVLFVLVAPLNALTTRDTLLFALPGPFDTSHMVDGVMLALGAGLLFASRRLKAAERG